MITGYIDLQSKITCDYVMLLFLIIEYSGKNKKPALQPVSLLAPHRSSPDDEVMLMWGKATKLDLCIVASENYDYI